MGKLKPMEVIVKIDFAASNGLEIVAHAEKVSELVRCKDCIHAPILGIGNGFNIEWPKIDGLFEDSTCPYFCDDDYYSIRPDPEWFCHRGERRDSE